MKAELVPKFEYFKCPFCGAEWFPVNEDGLIDSTEVWQRPNGDEFCSEQCGDTDLQIEQRKHERDNYEAGRDYDRIKRRDWPDYIPGLLSKEQR